MQKFHKGDLVRVAKDLETHDCDAIVMYSYADQYGGNDTKSYCLYLKGEGQCSWYEEHQLSLIENNKLDILEQWKTEIEVEHKLKSDLDWIFEHGDEILKSAHGASIQALASCFGLDNLWGSHGEGIAYYSNANNTLILAKPFLKTGDKTGWLKKAKEIRLTSN